MINSLYIQRSFVLLGKSLKGCLGCKYCRLLDGSADNAEYSEIPSNVNPNFIYLPIAVNLFYGDPTLQVESTVNYLRLLESSGHKGPVVVIIKGDFSKFPSEKFDLDLHFAFSTFGMDHPLDGGSINQFEWNLYHANQRNVKYSIEFRPIIYNVNDSDDVFEYVASVASDHGVSIGYSGLQGKPGVVSKWVDQKLQLNPYPGYEFGHKKIIGTDTEHKLLDIMHNNGVNTFRHTSCLISHVHNLPRDYNAHYYRPNEVGCATCPHNSQCSSFKSKIPTSSKDPRLPYPHEIIYKENHVCVLQREKICKYPTDDCSHISGYLVNTDVPLTLADVRITKWISGLTVSSSFHDSPFLSSFWQS